MGRMMGNAPLPARGPTENSGRYGGLKRLSDEAPHRRIASCAEEAPSLEERCKPPHTMAASILPTSPATANDDELVQLDPDHPGFRDPVYRARRLEIAQISKQAREGEEAPRVQYTEEEHEVWRIVWKNLEPLHQRFACKQFFEGSEVVRLDRTRIPQLAEVNAVVGPVTGFQMVPVAGLVSARAFHQFLGRRRFLSTQYIRHPSTPLYTPEPDVVHEMVGHAASLASRRIADLNQLAGEVVNRFPEGPEGAARMKSLERVYWYTLEFGAVMEGEAIKAYGAGLLSSFGELGRFSTEATLAPMDLERIAQTTYDPTQYQATIFVAKSFEQMSDELTRWIEKL